MKKLILLFVFLLSAVGLGVLIHNHPAYVFVSIGHMSAQASLWFVIVALMVGIFLVHQLMAILQGIYHIPSNIQHFLSERREKKSHTLDQKALRALLEERWSDCETYLNKSAKKQSYPFFHYVGAAQAAFEQRKEEAANRYLSKAQKVAHPSESLVLDMVRVRWQLSMGNDAQALQTLLLLQKISPMHPFVLTGLKDVYLKAHNWQKLSELLPDLRRHTTLDAAELDLLEQHVLSASLEQAGQSKHLEETWHATSKKWRENPALLAIYAKYLIAQNQHEQAEKLLKMTLRKQLDEALLEQYAHINSKDPVKQLARAEVWLKQNPHNAALLFCLGKLCARHRLWGKAKTYLEASLKYQPRVQIYPVLGEVLEQLDQKHDALACYKKGLEMYEKNTAE